MRDDWRGDGRMPISFRPKSSGGGGGPVLPQVASATLLLNLQADALSLSNNDPVALWPDASGNGNDFSQSTPSARPTYIANYFGHPAVQFPSGNPDYLPYWLEGPDFADNLTSFAVFTVGKYDVNLGNNTLALAKIQDPLSNSAPGWYVDVGDDLADIAIKTDNTNSLSAAQGPLVSAPGPEVVSGVVISKSEAHDFWNGSNTGEVINSLGTVTSIHNTQIVRIGASEQGISDQLTFSGWLQAIMIYAPAPDATDRTAIEAWLATKYGITF